MYVLIKLVLVLLLCQSVTFCQQSISGPQSGTLGPGNYEVTGNITVGAGNKLTIEPGTDFEHGGSFSWKISGELKAVGTADEKIRFVSTGSSKWGGIQFLQGSSDESILDHCVIDKCNRSQDGAGISVSDVSVIIQNSTISNCQSGGYGGGIGATNSSLTIRHCVIEGNSCPSSGGGGINLYDCDKATVEYCTIRENSTGAT